MSLIAPIPVKTVIVDKLGAISIFFRQRWEEVRTAAGRVAAAAIVTLTGQTAALATQLIYTTPVAGLFRVTYTARRTVVDGVASSFQFTWHWTSGGTPFSDAGTNDTTDTTGHIRSESRMVPVDANTNLTFDMAYTSNTPAKMTYEVRVVAELIAQA